MLLSAHEGKGRQAKAEQTGETTEELVGVEFAFNAQRIA